MKIIFIVTLFAFVPLAPARAIDFDKLSQAELCEAIQEVSKLRKEKFQTILGEPSKYNPKNTFAATHVLVGMRWCRVLNYPSVTMYGCVVDREFAKGDLGNRQALAYLEKVHARLAECLKPYSTSRDTTLNGIAIIYGIPPYPANSKTHSAVVLSVINSSVYVDFNEPRE